MPIIDGKRVKARFTSLKLGELSGVDRPAQEGALAVILKRDDRADGAWQRFHAALQKSSPAGEGPPVSKEVTMSNFNTRVREIAKRDGVAEYVAMGRARREFPDEFAQAYSEQPQPVAFDKRLDAGEAAVAKARADFGAIVRTISERDRIPEYRAMTKARREAPDAFAAAYGLSRPH